MVLINIKNVSKKYRVKKISGNFWKDYIRTSYIDLIAVDNVSFEINKGEIIGFLGPNGAGKSTTIKMLTGILTPTSGKVTVNGLIPYKNRKDNAKQIGVLFGQRSQLWWELPVIDSLNLLKKMYKISDESYNKKLQEFYRYLDLDSFITKPVRQLSLGQRIRCELAASLLHNPKILFLDEPTIGLDLLVKDNIRKYIKKLNEEQDVTIIITSHDIGDIKNMCDRIIVIDKGSIVYDGKYHHMLEKYGRYRTIIAKVNNNNFHEPNIDYVHLYKREESTLWFKFDKFNITSKDAISTLLDNYDISDITIEETSIEDAIKQIYNNEKT